MVQATTLQTSNHADTQTIWVWEGILRQVEVILEEKKQTGADVSLIQSKILQIVSGENPQKDKSTVLSYIKDISSDLYDVLPQVLKDDPEVIRVALKAWLSISKIPHHHQAQDDFIILSFDALVQKWQSPIFLVDFIEAHTQSSTKNSLRMQKKLIKKLRSILEKTRTNDSYDQILAYLYLDDTSFYKQLFALKIFDTQNEQVVVSPWFIKKIQDSVSKKWEHNIAADLTIAVERFFNQHFKYRNTYLSTIQDKIITQLIRTQKTQEKAKWEDEEENASQVNPDEASELEDTSLRDTITLFPHYSYTTHWDYYSFWAQWEVLVDIPRQFAESMSETSVVNYISFSKLMRELWLNFLLSKHLSKIMIATDTDFFSENGMTESRTLSFLNSIGKNLWIPEKSYQHPDSQEKLVSCFNTLAAAKQQFLQVKSTGYIWSEYIISPWDTWGKSIVEIALKLKWLIVRPYDEISLASWKK